MLPAGEKTTIGPLNKLNVSVGYLRRLLVRTIAHVAVCMMLWQQQFLPGARLAYDESWREIARLDPGMQGGCACAAARFPQPFWR